MNRRPARLPSTRALAVLAFKDLQLLFRDKLAVVFVFVVPIAFGLFFGLVSSGFETSDATLELGVLDQDQSIWSRHFVEGLEASEAKVVVRRFADRDAAVAACRRGRIGHVLVIPQGFGKRAGLFWEAAPKMELIADPARAMESGMVEGLVMQALGHVAEKRMRDTESVRRSLDEFTDSLQQDDDLPLPARLALTAAMKSFSTFMEQIAEVPDPEAEEASARNGPPSFQLVDLKRTSVDRAPVGDSSVLLENIRSGWDLSIPQATLWGLLGCSATFAVSLVRERRWGTLLRLQAAPISRSDIVLGKSLACFLSLLLVLAVMFLFGLALGMRPRTPWLLVLAMPAIAFCFVGVMALMSLMGNSEESVSGAAWGANIAMAMFGGGMIPLAFMPGIMQKLSYIDPARWAVLLLEGVVWRQFTLTDALLPLAGLIGAGILTLGLAAAIMQRRAT